MEKRKRPYRQKVRKEQQELTRLRIVEALVELHGEIGPKNTTIAAVAQRAGVQRLTVYRHFEDENSMLQACSGHWLSLNPPPNEREWEQVEDPFERVFAALLAIHSYFGRSEVMLSKVFRDVSEVEGLVPIVDGFDQYFSGIADSLVSDLTSSESGDLLKPMCLHWVRFSTWQSLSKENLSAEQVARAGLSCIKSFCREAE